MSQEAARSQADPEGRARVMFSMVPQFLISSMDKQVSLLGEALLLCLVAVSHGLVASVSR